MRIEELHFILLFLSENADKQKHETYYKAFVNSQVTIWVKLQSDQAKEEIDWYTGVVNKQSMFIVHWTRFILSLILHCVVNTISPKYGKQELLM